MSVERVSPELARPSWLPSWAVASRERVEHMARVGSLLESWATALGLPPAEVACWRDSGRLHDSMRDADEPTLRSLTQDHDSPVPLLHGPATAVRLAADGETRAELLSAVRFHTVGCADWGRLGRALFMADYLDPGRAFDREGRARLTRAMPEHFDSVFCQVMRARLEWLLGERLSISGQTLELWNRVCATGVGE